MKYKALFLTTLYLVGAALLLMALSVRVPGKLVALDGWPNAVLIVLSENRPRGHSAGGGGANFLDKIFGAPTSPALCKMVVAGGYEKMFLRVYLLGPFPVALFSCPYYPYRTFVRKTLHFSEGFYAYFELFFE